MPKQGTPKKEKGCAEAGLGGPIAFACSRKNSLEAALAVDLAAYGPVFTRGTPPRKEGCRTASRGYALSLMT